MTVVTASPTPAPVPSPITGPDLLNRAAVLLPTVVGRYRMNVSHVHEALVDAALLLRGCSPVEAHRLADEAAELFIAYLASVYDVAPQATTPQALSGWVLHRRVATAVYALRAAAEHWRAELILAASETGR